MNNNWIFLRGLTRGNIHWGNFKNIFESHNPGAHLEFMEIPGNGSLNKLSTPTEVKALLYYLRTHSTLMKLNEPIHLVGISLGGMVALKWCELYPEDIKTIAVLNCSLNQYSSFYLRLNPKNYLKIVNGLLFHKPYDREDLILQITSRDWMEHNEDLHHFRLFAEENPVSHANFIRQLILASKINIQTLNNRPLTVLVSKHDQLVSSKCSELISHHLGGHLVIHPTAGHDLPLDEPVWLSEQLMKQKDL